MIPISSGARPPASRPARVAAILKAVPICVALVALAAPAAAQMTVQGQVRDTAGAPIADVVVSIRSLDLDTRTTQNGRYNFIIRTAQIRGQAARIVARHARFGSQSAELQIVGGSVVQDFVLGRVSGSSPLARLPWPGTSDWARTEIAAQHVVDTAEIGAFAGPVDVMSALGGHVPGLAVIGATTVGGSAPAFYRGPRTISGNSQPLIVVDGVAIDNRPLASSFQRFGQGGFDYGSPVQRFPLEDVESVVLLRPSTAALLYGARAANGVLVVTTKSGRAIDGLHFSFGQRLTMERAARLPAFQNLHGQGLNGAYEFFDGQGGGINDDVAESWGPILDARPTLQHSLTEPRQADVRHWLPQPDDVRDYFAGAHTLAANAAMLGSLGWSNFRVSVNARDASGLTPRATDRQLGGALTGSVRPASALQATAHFRLQQSRARNRPGTGFHELNPVAGFTRMGRQVDLDALERNITDENGAQINWIYTDRNNPFFATSRNRNEDKSTDMIGGADVRYDLAPWLRMSLEVNATHMKERRLVAVDGGWLGGYPGLTAPSAFSGGGTDEQRITRGERGARLSSLFATDRGGFRLSGSAGSEFRVNELSWLTRLADDAPGGSAETLGDTLRSRATVQSWFVAGGLDRGASLNIGGGARIEQTKRADGTSTSAAYPFATAAYDLAPHLAFMRERMNLGSLTMRGSWWQAGNELSDADLHGVYFGGDSVGIANDGNGAEKTQGMEFGLDVTTSGNRLMIGVLGYRARSTNLLIATAASDGSAQVMRSGDVFNSGYELTAAGEPLRGIGWGWHLSASFAHNENTVDAVLPAAEAVPLAPAFLGVTQMARVGHPAGVMVGTRYLRDDSGALILRNGLPIADASTPFSILGSWQPDWTASLASRIRLGSLEVYVHADTRRGGKMFSGTNLTGGSAGTLAFTLPGREDGIVVSGIDSVTGAPNTTSVSAQDYFHALAGIHEAWMENATSTRLREMRITWAMSGRSLGFAQSQLRISLIGRNLLTFAPATNVDSETSFSTGVLQGFEIGQLPTSKSLGLVISLAP